MKLMHISDLHIGKRVNEFSMIEDQRFILEQMIEIAINEKVDGILIAGDIYDKSQPSSEAVLLLDYFLTSLTDLDIPVFVISGNHDSPERLNFGSKLLHKNKLYITSMFHGTLESFELTDEYGAIRIYLLPFLKPAMLRPFFAEPIDTYDEAIKKVIQTTSVDTSKRNILLAHQFIINGSIQPERSDSENISVGGLDQIDASAFKDFDYVALGHLHGPQKIGRDTIRYSGSPLKYSFSEVHQKKSVVVLEIKNKGEITTNLIPLTPKHDMRKIKGPIEELIALGKADAKGMYDYIYATLTNEEELYDAIGQLRAVYPNIMGLDYENSKTQTAATTSINYDLSALSIRSPLTLFSEFYKMQNNSELAKEQEELMEDIFLQSGENSL
ncbi:exonuclease SbcCD subunit D [Candidatus Galacturonibacter soehngenii]|uniref:Nuclease SbcCD subunit D n=1 Tax=Candidatus Galacturonatibacter soehngenii TaxID=2307010 RepID=A0A7V7UFD3_9FIRM|nr:exonuclease SbcCD subunit D [Candidatus Galacturonibacter soehngenii]KAB1436560.1 exonuclease SbcCD subunit D [Candidatus Galacturonibacter soehngenii]